MAGDLSKLSERDAIILQMWDDDYSGSQIAAELGVTRNVVMGALNRMRKKGIVGHKIKPKKAPVFYDFGEVPFGELKQYNQCRYIVNDGPASHYLFCGKPKEKGSYCAYHASICYIPSKHSAEK